MTKNGWKQIVVREDTYRLFQKYRGLLMAREERKISEDEAVRTLLTYVPPTKWLKEPEVNHHANRVDQ